MDRIEKIKSAIRDVPDFPKKGIIFKDITPLLQDTLLFSEVIALMAESMEGRKIEHVAAIESRGFIFGAPLALRLKVGFIPVRKPGKLPFKKYREEYQLEYGTDALEIHQDAIRPGDRILILDDLLATGGTALAAARLVERSGGMVDTIMFLVELQFLNGIQQINKYNVESFIKL